MAYPTVETADTQTDGGTSAPATVNYPSNLVSGDLIMCLFANDQDRIVTIPSGFVGGTRIFNGGSPGSGGCTASWFKKTSDGTESGNTFSVSISSSVQWLARTFRITGWGGTLGTTFANDSNSGDLVTDFADDTSTTPDPPSVDPATWSVEDAVVFAWYVKDTGGATTSYPSGYNDIQTTDTNACTLGICADFAIAPASSYDPGNFVVASENWIASTTVIRGISVTYSPQIIGPY